MFAVREVDRPRMLAIEAEVAEIAGQLNALNGRLAVLVAEYRSMGGCADLLPSRWVAWRLGCSAAAAGAVAAVAERIEDLPVTVGGLVEGAVSVDQAACIARHAPAYADAEVRGFARSMTVAQLGRVCRAYPHFDRAEPDEVEAAGWRPGREQVSAGFDELGWWQLRARLDADRGAVVDGALAQHYHALVADRPGPDAELPTLGDALVRMAQCSLGGADRAAAAQVVVHVDQAGVTSLHQGLVLDDRLAALLCCDAAVQIQFEQNRRALSVGRRSRTVPAALRRHVEHRDGGCRVPGCGRRYVQVHHVTHWSAGGTTDPSNLIALCPAHHRAHHLGRVQITGADAERPDGIEFGDRWGRALPTVSPPTPPDDRSPPHVASYRHPAGGRLHARDVVFQSADRRERKLRAAG